MPRGLIQSFILSLIFAAAVSQALEMEYVSPEQKAQLVKDFEQAKVETAEGLLNKKWNCDMYGVRSRLQVQRNVKLYSFKRDFSGAFKNYGSQVVADYKSDSRGLLGLNDRFEDQLRMTPSGQLISRLSLRQPEPIVLAYAVCKSL